jgi:hypothetical protein
MRSVQLRKALLILWSFYPEIVDVSLRLFILIRPERAELLYSPMF